MPKPIRRRSQRSATSPIVWVALCAGLALILGLGFYAVRHQQAAQQGGQAGRATIQTWTDEILAQWKRGQRHTRDGGHGPIFNLNAWTFLESEINAKGTRVAARYTIDSASQSGTPARVNWTFAWVKQSKGWTLCAVLPTDEAGAIDTWRWQ